MATNTASTKGQCNGDVNGHQCPSTKTTRALVVGGVIVSLCDRHLSEASVVETYDEVEVTSTDVAPVRVGDPHPTHCCAKHGCKYGPLSRSECTVKNGSKEQVYPCEYCEEPETIRAQIAALTAELEWSEQIYTKTR